MKVAGERDFFFRRWSDLSDLDWYILGPTIFLISISLLLLKSAASGEYIVRQFTFLIPILFLGILTLLSRIQFWQKNSWLIYWISILLLLVVLFMGSAAMGAQRWINIGFVKIQPSELSKIAVIISLAAWFVKNPIKHYIDIVKSGFVILLPFILVFKQPDLGTSLTFISIYLGMALWAGASLTQLLLIVSPVLSLLSNAIGDVVFNFGTLEIRNRIVEINITSGFLTFMFFILVWFVIAYKPWQSPWKVLFVSLITILNFLIGFIRPVLWGFLHPYQQRRLTIFLNPESDPLGAGYHIIQSLLAIGNGGLFGYGWQNGRLTKGNYVPAQHTDFIFSICGEEFGFVGALIVAILFGILLFRILYIAKNTNSNFASLICIGVFSYLSFHVFINIGMAIGIMPITGVPLVLLSYGGTALLVALFSIFLVLSISYRTLPRKMF